MTGNSGRSPLVENAAAFSELLKMSKRANDGFVYVEGDGWTFVGQGVVDALRKAPKAKYVRDPKDYAKPKAFADPRKPGYGGGEWPFDRNLAYISPSFRTGIRKAINAKWTDGYWKHEARRILQEVLGDLLAVYDIDDE